MFRDILGCIFILLGVFVIVSDLTRNRRKR